MKPRTVAATVYRDDAPLAYDLAPRRRWWRRAFCVALYVATLGHTGHRWRIVRTNVSKAVNLAHLHPLAGVDAYCTRCGSVWLDALPWPGVNRLVEAADEASRAVEMWIDVGGPE